VRLRALAPAKINLCLFLGPLRSDGRHELVTLFESLSLSDELELETLPDGPDRVVCAEVPEDNLVARALSALRRRGWAGPPVQITIRKRIPVAGGMAGGSADAAAALRLAVTLAPGGPGEVEAVAAELGSDVPAQLAPGASLGTGAGHLVERLGPLPTHALIVVPLARELSTPAVYAEADRLELPRPAEELRTRLDQVRAALASGARPPQDILVNDLEPAAVSLCPPVADALAQTRAAGAEQVMVSGSGPTVLGLWWGEDALARAAEAADTLVTKFPRATAVTPVDASVGVPEVI
jgi:4-diphosphocytidyl-2-C-methyl-D-erythritol kinase